MIEKRAITSDKSHQNSRLISVHLKYNPIELQPCTPFVMESYERIT